MNSIIKEFTNNVEETFEGGVDKFNYDLKAYTGPALEKLGKKALELCCENLDIEYDSIDQKYLTHEKLDSLRLDDHLKINGKIVIMQEDRAWMDKPFYSMKIHTINQIKTFLYLLYNPTKNIAIKHVYYSFLFAFTVKTDLFNLN